MTQASSAVSSDYVVSATHSAIARAFAASMLLIPAGGTAWGCRRVVEGEVGWFQLACFGCMYALAAIGVSVGYHRHLAHRAFDARPWTRTLLMGFGAMALQGPPVYWAALHRRHHERSDAPGDPHSPHITEDAGELSGLRGLLHAHVGWQFSHGIPNPLQYCRDLLRDPLVQSVNRSYGVWGLLGLALPTFAGYLVLGGWAGALDGLVWGGLVRLFVSYHATNSINSITHVFGSRAFATRDHSRNTAVLALITFGEAWHNNHHAFPSSAVFGLRWWQIDLGGATIRVLARLGVVTRLRRPSPAAIAAFDQRMSRRAEGELTEGRAVDRA
jgi:stearoyl-CoA desaturase (Delta-9 desaturase)